MPIDNDDIRTALAAYLEQHPEESEMLAEPLRMLDTTADLASRRSFPTHVTVGALLVREGAEVLLIEHRAYGITLQQGGHLEQDDVGLTDAALRELVEETGVEPTTVVCVSNIPAYVEYVQVPARPDKDEPVHHHLDIGFLFTTECRKIGNVQQSEVTGAARQPVDAIEQFLGQRLARASSKYTKPAGSA